MSVRKAVVEVYFEGCRRSDHQRILACLTDAAVWDLPGYRHLTGKDAFDGEIENDDFVGSPTLIVDRLIQEADTVVAIGNGETTHRTGVVSFTGARPATSSSRARQSAGSSRTSFSSRAAIDPSVAGARGPVLVSIEANRDGA